jgi:hypothetical protein
MHKNLRSTITEIYIYIYIYIYDFVHKTLDLYIISFKDSNFLEIE